MTMAKLVGRESSSLLSPKYFYQRFTNLSSTLVSCHIVNYKHLHGSPFCFFLLRTAVLKQYIQINLFYGLVLSESYGDFTYCKVIILFPKHYLAFHN